MSLIWMPPQTTVPPFLVAASAAGTSEPTGAKISAASSGSGGCGRRIAGPFRAERAREILCRRVAGAGEGEEPAALMARHLGHDVRGGAKAVDPEALRVARHAQGAIADQPGAHQWRRLDIAVTRIDRKAVALVGDGQLGIAAVDLVAGEAGAVAQILLPAAAILAHPAGPAEPRHPDPVADRESIGRFALLDDGADDLVPGDQRQLRIGEARRRRRADRSGTPRRPAPRSAAAAVPDAGPAAPPAASGRRAAVNICARIATLRVPPCNHRRHI